MSSPLSPSSSSRPPLGVRLVIAIALVVAFLPVLQPLLGRQITCGYDNAFHLLRAVEIDYLWEQGIFYTRWAPDMALGFGFPLFVFASPFSQSLITLAHRLGLGWPVAMNAVFVLGILVAGGAMFWLVRTLTGAMSGGSEDAGIAGGLLAAVAYVYSPFLAYDVFNRGSLWESLAWAFPPLILLGLHRWCLNREGRFLALGVGAFAAMIFSHYPFAFLFAPVLGLWVLLHAYLKRDWKLVWRGVVLGGFALGITAFFWLPPVLERANIQTDRLLGTWVFDYRYNFLPLQHLFALPRRADPNLVNDWPPKSLGLVHVLLALLPALRFRKLVSTARWQFGLLWGLVLGFAVLTLKPSLWLWDHVPLLSYVQFPWRYLGPAAFCLSLLVGRVPSALLDGHSSRRKAGLMVAVLAGSLILANLGWLYPRACSPPPDLTVPGIISWERQTDTIGTTAKGEYLPIWVERFPDIVLDDAYAEGMPIPRMRSEDLPDAAEILATTYGAISSHIEISTPVGFVARYLVFHYPGWRVTVDGVSVEVTPEAETGLLTFDVPAGNHVIDVRFGETPQQLAGDVVSAVVLMALAIVIIRSPRHYRHTRLALRAGLAKIPGWLLGMSVVLVAIKLWVVDPAEILWRGSRLDAAGVQMDAAQPLNANFGNRAVLLGTDPLPQDVSYVSYVETPVLTLYWRALEPGDADWQIGLTLVGSDGSRWQVGTRPARWARIPPPLYEWPEGDYARMDRLLDLPPGLAPGNYSLELALFNRATAEPASVLDDAGNPVAPALVLGEMRIAVPPEPPSLVSLGVTADSSRDCGALRLLGAGLGRQQAAPGDLVGIDMVWESQAVTTEAADILVTLVDVAGNPVREWVISPSAPWWPTTQWQPGERWVGKAELRLPGTLESGDYTLALDVAACRAVSLPLQVEAPPRTWQLPADFIPADTKFGDHIRLSGYELPEGPFAPGDLVPLTLAWKPLVEIETPYRVFVHLVDAEGNLVAQNDGEPVGWTRPTPGWALGEVVIDPRPLQVPDTAAAGLYELRVGLYDPQGQRLVTDDGADSPTIAVVSLVE